MSDVGKMLMVFGVVLVIAGAILWSGFGRGWLGKLPGDIHVTKGNFTFYFPIVTCILASIVLTIIMRLFRK